MAKRARAKTARPPKPIYIIGVGMGMEQVSRRTYVKYQADGAAADRKAEVFVRARKRARR